DSSMCGGAGGAEGFSVVAGENPPGEREGRATGACQPRGRPASPAALQHPGGSSYTAAAHRQHRPPAPLHRATRVIPHPCQHALHVAVRAVRPASGAAAHEPVPAGPRPGHPRVP
ncbi:unnamed protein product, partial [Closterium sp. NIES-54]